MMSIKRSKPTAGKPEFGGTPYQYYGFGDFIGMAFLCSALIYDHGFHIADTEIVNEAGDMLGNIGAEGMDAVAGSILDENVPVGEIGETVGLEGVEELKTGGVEEMAVDSGNWFDGIFDGDGFDFDLDL